MGEVEDGTSDAGAQRASQARELFLQALEGGTPPDLDDLIARHPDLEPELRDAHAEWAWLDALAGARPPARGLERRADLVEAIARASHHPRYEVVNVVASGGMGTVLRVHDAHLARHVAMKVSDARRGGSSDAGRSRSLFRFLEEAQVMGQLDHAGVVPVYDVGFDGEGHAYFTMRLVEGLDLKDVLREVHAGSGEWTVHAAVRVLVRVCETVAYAHEKGVLHRDLKPSNVRVARHGGVYVMDWGLARVGDADPDRSAVRSPRKGDDAVDELHTLDGAVLGTPAYMSPEQAAGEHARLDARTDVYSVGAILYQLLAGEPPYGPLTRGGDTERLLEEVRARPPRALSEVAPRAAPELVAICERAMARDPSRRYADMGALAEDLRRWLEHRPVMAYPAGPWTRVRKWIARNPSWAAAGALAAAGAVGAATLTLRAEMQRTREARRFNEELAERNTDLSARESEARRLRERADLVGDAAALEAALAHLEVGRRPQAEAMLEQIPEERRGWSWRNVSARLDGSELRFADPDGEAQRALALDPLGPTVASGTESGKVRLWDAHAGELRGTLGPFDAGVARLAYSPDGGLLAVALVDGQVLLLERTGAVVRTFQEAHGLVDLEFSHDGRFLVTLTPEGMHALDPTTGERTAAIEGVWNVALSPQGDECAVVRKDVLERHALADGALLARCDLPRSGFVTSFAWQPDGERLVIAEHGGALEFRVAETLGPLFERRPPLGYATHVEFSTDGGHLAVAGAFESVQVLDVRTGEPVRIGVGHDGEVLDLAWAAWDARLWTASDDGTVRAWDVSGSSPFEHALDLSTALAHAPDRTRVLTALEGRPLVLDPVTNEVVAALERDADPDPRNQPVVAEWSGTTPYAALAHAGRGVQVWSTDDWHLVYRGVPTDGRVRHMAFHPSEPLLACGWIRERQGGGVTLLDVETGEVRSELGTFPLGPSGRLAPTPMAFAPDGTLLTGGADGLVRRWDPSDGRELQRLQCGDADLWSLVLDRQGRRFACGGATGVVTLVDLAGWTVERQLLGHSQHVLDVDFSADGGRLATAGADRTVRLWDAATGVRLLSLTGQRGFLHNVVFGPDERWLLTVDGRRAFLWTDERAGGEQRALRAAFDTRRPYVEGLYADGATEDEVLERIARNQELDARERRACRLLARALAPR